MPSSHESNLLEPDETSPTLAGSQSRKRTASVYDAVAGRVGLNGFLTNNQQRSIGVTALRPEDVLLRRVNAPSNISHEFYAADQHLDPTQKLPEADLLQDVHTYASRFYRVATPNAGCFDCKSLDETALLALGILLEEASKECLGETGDLVFTEAESTDRARISDARAEKQIIGRVMPKTVHEYKSDNVDDEEEEVVAPKRKRRRFRHRSQELEQE